MAKARSSLTFKGPANEKRVRKPPALPEALVKPSNTGKKKSIRKVSKSAQVEDDDVNLERGELSEKQKGKRRAVDVEVAEPGEERSRRGFKIAHYKVSTSSSTVEKTWKPLSQSAKGELVNLAKQAESQVLASLPSSSSTTDFRNLLATYQSSFDEILEDLACPPVPSTLKPRNAAKDSVEFVDSEMVKKKIDSTRLALEKEEEQIKEMEEELEQIKRPQSKAGFKAVDSEEEDDVIIELPVKKKKRIASNKAAEASVQASSTKPHVKLTEPTQPPPAVPKPRKPILKPSLSIPRHDEDDSDEFDTFPQPRSKPKTTTSKVVSKTRKVPDSEGTKVKGAETNKKKVRYHVEV